MDFNKDQSMSIFGTTRTLITVSGCRSFWRDLALMRVEWTAAQRQLMQAECLVGKTGVSSNQGRDRP